VCKKEVTISLNGQTSLGVSKLWRKKPKTGRKKKQREEGNGQGDIGRVCHDYGETCRKPRFRKDCGIEGGRQANTEKGDKITRPKPWERTQRRFAMEASEEKV